MAKGTLDGVKVVEFGHFLLVPTATAILADWGADVVKIENFRTGGDPVRFPSAIEGQPPPTFIKPSMWIHYFNRNKRGIGLNVMTDHGREILYKLVERADVFATNFDPRAIEKAKADYDTLKKVNPRLIYCQCSGYGSLGPDRHKPGFDYAAWWARSGMMDRISAPDASPRPQRAGLGDNLSSPAIAGAIAAALFCRERTGVAQKVEINLYHMAVWGMSFDIGTALNQGVNLKQTDRREVTNALWNCYRTKDGKWIMLVMPQTDRYWPAFCKAIGKPEWEKDARFDSFAKRIEQNKFLIAALDEILGQRTAAEWESIAQEFDLVLGRIQTPMEVAQDPQAWENGFFEEVEYAPGKTFKMINSPVRFSESESRIRSIAPELGQHTEEILLELGYEWEDLAALKKEGTIL
ncbi:MAG: CoA transferase [Dehalococcoidia bacterium]|nr:CoA transferase [Dehalococcoidia bacterium]